MFAKVISVRFWGIYITMREKIPLLLFFTYGINVFAGKFQN